MLIILLDSAATIEHHAQATPSLLRETASRETIVT
jgi:hypothetical protein